MVKPPITSGLRLRGVLVALIVSVVAAASNAGAEPVASDRIVTDAGLAGRVDSLAARALDELRVAGFSVAVGRGGEVVFASGYGYADLPNRRAAGPETVYPIGSISKQFTAAAILRLVEEGRVSLHDPVSDYVTVPAIEPPPTVGQLLSHTAGFTDARLGPVLAATSDGVGLGVDEVMDLVVAAGYLYPPGSGHQYSNGGYLLAYRVIEAITGQPYGDHLTEAVLERSGLDESAMCPSTQPPSWAQGYLPMEGNWARAARLGRPLSLEEAGPSNMAIVNSVCSTTPDLVRWGHQLRSGEVVSPHHYRLMSSPTRLIDGTIVPYGLGLQQRRFGTHRAVAHGGIVGGFVGNLADFPDDDVTVALLINTHLPEIQAETLLTGVLAAVFEEPESRWLAADDTSYAEEES